MFNLSNLGNISDLLNNLDNAAKETLEEPKESATALRLQKKKQLSSSEKLLSSETSDDDYVNINEPSNEHFSDTINVSVNDAKESIEASISGIADAVTTEHDHQVEVTNTTTTNIQNATSKSVKSNNLPPVPPPSSSKITSSTSLQNSNHTNVTDTNAKQIIKSKNLEIEKLNSEILELEETCHSLKLEVQDAWNTYKTTQEKAATREGELLEEIKIIQKAKSSDKQQIQIQLTTMNDEISKLLLKIKSMETERDEYVEKIKGYEQEKSQFQDTIKQLHIEIDELKLNTLQGVQGLREENKKLISLNDELQQEKLNMIRNHESKLYEYETSHHDNIKTIRDKEKEILLLKSQLNMTGGLKDYQHLTRDFDQLQTDYDNLILSYNQMKDLQIPNYETKIRSLESELKVSFIRSEDENQRVNELLQMSDKKIIELQSELVVLKQQLQQQVSNSTNPYTGTASDSSMNINNNTVNPTNTNDKTTLLMEQIQNLSKQLLKKQEVVTELQTEKSVLKSKIMDITARCNHAEQEIARLKDVEDGYADDEDLQGGGSSSSSDEQSIGKYNMTPTTTSSTGKGLIHRTNAPVSSGGPGTTGNDEGMTTTFNTTPLRGKSSLYPSQSKYHYRSNSKGSSLQITNELEQLGVRPNASVVKAMHTIDSFTLLIGRFLRTHSIVRIFFVIYLLMLHIWVFVILAMHVHTIDGDMNKPPVPLVNNIIKRNIS